MNRILDILSKLFTKNTTALWPADPSRHLTKEEYDDVDAEYYDDYQDEYESYDNYLDDEAVLELEYESFDTPGQFEFAELVDY